MREVRFAAVFASALLAFSTGAPSAGRAADAPEPAWADDAAGSVMEMAERFATGERPCQYGFSVTWDYGATPPEFHVTIEGDRIRVTKQEADAFNSVMFVHRLRVALALLEAARMLKEDGHRPPATAQFMLGFEQGVAHCLLATGVGTNSPSALAGTQERARTLYNASRAHGAITNSAPRTWTEPFDEERPCPRCNAASRYRGPGDHCEEAWYDCLNGHSWRWGL